MSCNVLCSEAKTLLQISDYPVIQLVKAADNGNRRGLVLAIMCSLKPNIQYRLSGMSISVSMPELDIAPLAQITNPYL